MNNSRNVFADIAKRLKGVEKRLRHIEAWEPKAGAASGIGPSDASYLVLATNTSLENERVFVAGNGLGSTDGGAGGNFTVAVNVDNATVEISSDTLQKISAFAELHVHDSSTAQAIANGTTYVKLTCWTDNGLSLNCTPDQANDKITFTKAGIYRVSGSFSFSCGTNNTTFFGTVFFNGTEQDNIHWERKIGTAGDKGNAGFTGILDVASVPLDLDVRVRHDGGGSVDITVYYANINVEYIGAT